MGTSYLTPQQEDVLANEFYNLHATFAKDIYIFRTAQEVAISTNPGNNYLYDSTPTNDQVQTIIQSGTFSARVLYGKKQDLANFSTTNQNSASDQVNVRFGAGDVRIKLDPTGAAFIDGAQRVTFDGSIFSIESERRPHGLFGETKFETFYLRTLE